MNKTILLFLLATSNAHGEPPIKLEEVSIDYKRFKDGGRDPLFFNSSPKEELNLNVNTSFFEFIFWNNKVHSMTDDTQYHIVGWNLHLGVHVTTWLDVYYEHFSRHILDDTYPFQRFPVADSLNLKIKLYSNPSKDPSIF